MIIIFYSRNTLSISEPWQYINIYIQQGISDSLILDHAVQANTISVEWSWWILLKKHIFDPINSKKKKKKKAEQTTKFALDS